MFQLVELDKPAQSWAKFHLVHEPRISKKLLLQLLQEYCTRFVCRLESEAVLKKSKCGCRRNNGAALEACYGRPVHPRRFQPVGSRRQAS